MSTDSRDRRNEAHRIIQQFCRDEIAPLSIIVVAAHPDDEVIGAGGLLPRIRDDAYFIHVTDGSPQDPGDARAAGCATREDYAALRRRELAYALSQAGIGIRKSYMLGFGDQKAAHSLGAITRRLSGIMGRVEPDVVLTHPYEGGHPDHDSTAFAVQLACELLLDGGRKAPPVIEFTSYHAGPGGMRVGEFLPSSCPVTELVLNAQERALKRRMFDCFRSQHRVLEQFPIGVERFRPAPEYDFLRPPHPGTLHYENFEWGVSGAGWRNLARTALDSIGSLAWR
jgi:N-acetylglucosamine malate deacetylase 2